MVGLVLVSHSHQLAKAAAELAKGVNKRTYLPIAYAGGTGSRNELLGTDTTAIIQAIMDVYSDYGVLVLMDLGSSIISTKLAIEMLGDSYSNIRMCPAPIVEGAVAAAVQILAGSSLNEVYSEAMGALTPKQVDLHLEKEDSGRQDEISNADSINYVFRMGLDHGLHTRPAANLVNAIAPFKATVTAANLTQHTPPVNAKSLNKLALSNIMVNDEVKITASGQDAAEAIAAVKELVEKSFGGEAPAKLPIHLPKAPPESQILTTLSPGIAIGVIYQADTLPKDIVPEKIADVKAELAGLDKAVSVVGKSINASKNRLLSQGLKDEGAIFDAHLMILNDNDILSDVKTKIEKEKLCAAYLYLQKMTALAGEFRALPNEYMKERAADIMDVAKQVVAQLTGEVSDIDSSVKNVILAAHEVTPSLLSKWDTSHLKGVITEIGGSSSHVSIIAKAMSIPAVTGYKLPEKDLTGVKVLIDATNLEVILNPAPEKEKEFIQRYNDWEESKKADITDSQGKALSKDGVYVPVMGNVGDVITAKSAAQNGAEGVGLLRTEFLFLNRRQEPTEAEQITALSEVFSYFKDMPIIVRTLDIGGDKHLDWLTMPKEDNPFLGVRGIRLCMENIPLFRKQLRAILQAAYGYDVRIMIPMVSVPGEVTFTREILAKSHEELANENKPHLWPVKLGIMVETPAAVVMADDLAKISDFFSIGTNDLSQYIMSAERGGRAALAKLLDSMQPSVLRAIKLVAQATKRNNIELSVCGEMAGDPFAAKMLLGLGVDDLSMNGSAIGKVKRMIRNTELKKLDELAEKALKCSAPEEVRKLFQL